MNDRIIPLHGGRTNGEDHLDAQMHLPWYLTGKLAPAEHARVAAHLSVCAECQAELEAERSLDAAYAALPLDVEHGWRKMHERLAPRPRLGASLTARLRSLLGETFGGGRWQGFAIAGQLVLLLFVSAALLLPRSEPAIYRALGGKPGAAAGNVVVIFRPDTPELSMRRALAASEARLVDGPTPAGAYVLHIDAAGRPAALAALRRDPGVVMAEPIDAGRAP